MITINHYNASDFQYYDILFIAIITLTTLTHLLLFLSLYKLFVTIIVHLHHFEGLAKGRAKHILEELPLPRRRQRVDSLNGLLLAVVLQRLLKTESTCLLQMD